MDNSITKNAMPWHFWMISLLATAWFAMGCLDYVMTQTQNEGYLAGFSAQQIEYYTSFPAWADAVWALSVWGGLLACLCLLLRRKLATTLFLLSIVTYVIAAFHNFVLTNGAEIMGSTAGYVMSVAILVIAIALYLYSRSLASKGQLN